MTCPCGYLTECGIWCGDGHISGLCLPLDIPDCPTCGPARIESHPKYCVVRCANCKEWLAR